jgi:hypothetical protein
MLFNPWCGWLQVHWLRVLIDEGHSLGASLGLTNKLAMAMQLRTARRWVMTGTPTPATAAGTADTVYRLCKHCET